LIHDRNIQLRDQPFRGRHLGGLLQLLQLHIPELDLRHRRHKEVPTGVQNLITDMPEIIFHTDLSILDLDDTTRERKTYHQDQS